MPGCGYGTVLPARFYLVTERRQGGPWQMLFIWIPEENFHRRFLHGAELPPCLRRVFQSSIPGSRHSAGKRSAQGLGSAAHRREHPSRPAAPKSSSSFVTVSKIPGAGGGRGPCLQRVTGDSRRGRRIRASGASRLTGAATARRGAEADPRGPLSSGTLREAVARAAPALAVRAARSRPLRAGAATGTGGFRGSGRRRS